MSYLRNSTEIYPSNQDLIMDEAWNQNNVTRLTVRITIEILSLISILCFVKNTLACFIIFKFERLRHDPVYKILANWFILNFFVLLTFPLFLRLITDWRKTKFVSYEITCSLGELNGVTQIGSIFLMACLTFHWYFKFYHPFISVKYDRDINYVIFTLNFLLILCFIQGVVGCVTSSVYTLILNKFIKMVIFPSYIISMIIIFLNHLRKKKLLDYVHDKNIPYILSIIYFLLYLSISIVLLICYVSLDNTYLLIVISIVSVLTFACPIYFFVILYKYDKIFNTFTRLMVTCRFNKYTDDESLQQPIHFHNLHEI